MPKADQAELDSTGGIRRRATLAIFILALAVHLSIATQHLELGNLAGHEFRQTQTALSILFIQRDNDFSLAYPTPLFGPPWSIPMEFPLYQWTVASVSNLTGWTLPFAARLISLACFYLTLPAIYLLLRRWKISPEATRLSLALILITPVYIFYSRTVLIESMALMASVWFLWAFDRMCRQPGFGWAATSTILGVIAILVKVTTFIPWCAAAAIIGLRWSWREWQRGGLRAWLPTVGWGTIIAAVHGVCIGTWLSFSDHIKAQSPGGNDLTSDALSNVNFGDWSDRIGGDSLTLLGKQMTVGTLPWWTLIPLVGLGILTFRSVGQKSLLLTFWFVATLLLFPVLYHRHDYYFYAVGILPVCAMGIVLDRWMKQRRLWAVAILAIAALVVGQAKSYQRNYWHLQFLVSNGGTGLTNFMRDMLPADAAIIVLGHDWAPTVPYYSQRRGVMIRDGVAQSTEKLTQHLNHLDGTKISALVVANTERFEESSINFITQKLDLESEHSITHSNIQVYLANSIRSPTLNRLIENMNYSDVAVVGTPDAPPPPPEPEPVIADSEIHQVTGLQSEVTFSLMNPTPYQYRCKFGLGASYHDGRTVIGAHPDSDMWIRVPNGSTSLQYQIGMDSGTFGAVDDSDGVIFKVRGIDAEDREFDLAEHHLDPAHNPDHQSVQEFETDLPAGLAEVILSTRPGQTYNFDWAYWQSVEIR